MIKSKEDLYAIFYNSDKLRYSKVTDYKFLGSAIAEQYKLKSTPRITTKTVWKDIKDYSKGVITYPFTQQELCVFLNIEENQL